MKLIREFIDPKAVQLNATQKAILATIASSPTPEMAFENCNGVQSFVIARNALRTLGLVRISAASMSLTDAGQDALITNNIVDDMGELTEDGKKLVDALQQEKTQQTTESYSLLSGFLT